MLKPGVLFLETRSGGILMDIAADRFLALSPFSAAVWGQLATGRSVPEVIDRIAATRGVARDSAAALLSVQLRKWEQAELTGAGRLASTLPQPRPASPPASDEWPSDAIQSARLAPRVMASLSRAQTQYRRALVKEGLAASLSALQAERGAARAPSDVVIRRTLRSYHASRRLFKQGSAARDCLVRSLALAAVLRRQGVDAALCIGIIDLPFASHAWVEADDRVLNETLRGCEGYTVIGRF